MTTVETTACPRPLGSVQMLPLADLRPWEANYRHHPADQLERIRESLRRNGQRKAVVVQASTMRIIAGHGVAEAARLEGWETIRCDVWDCSDEQAAGYLIDDNELSRHAVDDDAVLAGLLEDLRGTEYQPTAFTDAELQALLSAAGSEFDVLDFSPQQARDQAGGGTAWNAVHDSTGRVRLEFGDIEAALSDEIYEQVKTVLDDSYSRGGIYAEELERILRRGCE